MPELDHANRRLTWTVYATPLMTPTADLGLSIRVSMLELGETGDWDLFFFEFSMTVWARTCFPQNTGWAGSIRFFSRLKCGLSWIQSKYFSKIWVKPA